MWSSWSPIASVLSAPSYFISVMIWAGFIVPCSVSSRRTAMSVIEPLPWWPRIGIAVDLRDVDRVAGRVVRDVARRGVERVAALQRGDRRAQAAGGEELERREHAAVDPPSRGCRAGRSRRSRCAGCSSTRLLELALAHQQDLADRRGLGVAAEERVLALGAVDRGGLEQLPAVEDRLRVDARGAAAGRADLEQHVRRAVPRRCGRCGRGSCRR